jgi:hypothetical protein
MNTTKPVSITNCHRNIMGTVSFDGRFANMRKSQDFIVYPMQDSGPLIRIQSNNRMGQLNLDTGELVLSPAATGHAGFLWLQVCIARRTAFRETLPADDLQTLRQWVKSTGGLLVGASFVKSDNTGALAL